MCNMFPFMSACDAHRWQGAKESQDLKQDDDEQHNDHGINRPYEDRRQGLARQIEHHEDDDEYHHHSWQGHGPTPPPQSDPGTPRLFFHQHVKPVGAGAGDRVARLFFPGHFIPAPFFNEGTALVGT
jgi:hypothetical protein